MSYKCIYCDSPINITKNATKTTCSNCESEYFQVNEVPILIEGGLHYLNDNFASITTHQKRTTAYLNDFGRDLYLKRERQEAFDRISAGYNGNLALYGLLLDELRSYTQPDLLAQSGYSDFEREPLNGKEINYFIRDWGGLKEGEEEVETLLDALNQQVEKHAKNKEAIFFAGSGTGRFMLEQTTAFKAVYGTDLSFRMTQFFNLILQGKELEAHHIPGLNNVYSLDDVSKAVTIKNRSDKPFDNIHHFVSDIRNIPLTDGSLDVFASIYFLDVMNIETYIQEIHRVLNDDGVYINIGPIGYPRNAISGNLLPEEIKAVFESNGFVIEEEHFVEVPYMYRPYELSKIIHKNWVFTARKVAIPRIENLNLTSILALDKKVFTEKRAELSAEGEFVFFNRLYYSSGANFEDADLFIEILSRIDGTATIESIISLIQRELDVDLSFEELAPLLLNFIELGTLKIISL